MTIIIMLQKVIIMNIQQLDIKATYFNANLNKKYLMFQFLQGI